MKIKFSWENPGKRKVNRVNGMAKVSVMGAGGWGTALAILLHNNGHEVMLWSALGDEVNLLR